MIRTTFLGLLFAGTLLVGQPGVSFEVVKGNVGVEGYYYPRSVNTGQNHGETAVFGELELADYFQDRWQVRITPFFRYDPSESARDKLDLTEAFIEYVDDAWIARVGMIKLSWSVTEAVNIVPHQVVDIVNQRDFSGNPDGTEKLGAAALSLAYQSDDTLVEVFMLPWLRERRFPSTEAREHLFRGQIDLRVDPTYAGRRGEFRPAFALRAERVVGNTNLALILYSGYSPAPSITPGPGGKARVHYYLQDMVGLTVQSAVGTWLLKSETALVNTHDEVEYMVPDDYVSTVSGVEYTFIRPAATDDITAIAEWMYDSRGDDHLGSQYQNDLFIGARWTANDFDGSFVLGGSVIDLEDGSVTLHLEYSRRLWEQWRMEAVFRNHFASDGNALGALEDDLLLQFSLSRFF